MISKVFEAISEQVRSTIAAIGSELPEQKLGEENVSELTAPPAIVWAVRGGPVKPPRQTGADGNLGTRQIAQRSVRILVHVWNKDFTSTEILLNHFVAAARSVLTAFSFRALSEDWTTGQAARTNLGRLCVLEIEIDVPFTAEPIGVSAPPHVLTIETQVNPPQ